MINKEKIRLMGFALIISFAALKAMAFGAM
jgi:hypothetical protein